MEGMVIVLGFTSALLLAFVLAEVLLTALFGAEERD